MTKIGTFKNTKKETKILKGLDIKDSLGRKDGGTGRKMLWEIMEAGEILNITGGA